MKTLVAALLLSIAITPALAGESAGLMLPPGFHATVVADELGAGARHVVVRANGDLYISTRKGRDEPKSAGVIAVKVGKDQKAAETTHFSEVEGGTGMQVYKNALYVAGNDAIYRFKFQGNDLVPSAVPEVVVGNLPKGNMGVAFDDKS
ncbi:MAG: hypothetical protein ABI450_11980, partial [Rhizomicrobium sp.]